MLESAAKHKDELMCRFADLQYSEDYFYYNGWDCASLLPNLEPREDRYQYAITAKDGAEVIGFFAYGIDPHTDTVKNFGLLSFQKGNPLVGATVLHKMEDLQKEHYRLEWAVIDGNPVKRIYDRFCEKHRGYIHQMHDGTKDLQGQYRDVFLYEIVRGRQNEKGDKNV